MTNTPGDDLEFVVSAGDRLVAEGRFDELADLAREIENRSLTMSVDEQRSLRQAVAEWISTAAVIRAQCALQLKQMHEGSDAARAYKDVSRAT